MCIRDRLVRITSRENDDIDEGWICDRGRFDYTDVNDPARLHTPVIAGRKSTWADAISAVADGIKGKGAKLGISLPQDLTNEEAFLFRRLLDGPLRGARVKMHGRTAIQANDDYLAGKIQDIKKPRKHDSELSQEELTQKQLDANFRIMEQILARVDAIVKNPKTAAALQPRRAAASPPGAHQNSSASKGNIHEAPHFAAERASSVAASD